MDADQKQHRQQHPPESETGTRILAGDVLRDHHGEGVDRRRRVTDAGADIDHAQGDHRAEVGFGYITGTGSGTRKSRAVTFGAAFASAPLVLMATLGTRIRQDVDTPRPVTSTADFDGTTDDLRDWRAIGASVSGFTAELHGNGSLETSNRAGFAWLAIGEAS